MEAATRTIRVGDRAPLFSLPDENGEQVILLANAGKPSVLIFYAQDEIPACTEIICAFRDKIPEFRALGVNLFSISLNAPASRADFASKYEIPFPLLSDSQAKISKLYGVCDIDTSQGRQDLIFNRAIVLLDRNLRVIEIFSLEGLKSPVTEVLNAIKRLCPQEQPRHIKVQAPVLLIPNVISAETCRALMNIWEIEGHSDSGFMRQVGDKTVGYIDYSHKSREDHFIRGGKMKDYLNRMMLQRVFPEIERAFNFEATRGEDYKIACYDASRGGYFRAHRDNTTAGTKHRKFAMTLNLNVGEYEGGYLRFPEYGPHLYQPNTGSAIVFGCSLLHEATDVKEGRRFALLSFFYGEKEAEQRREYAQRVQNDYSKFIVKS